MTLRLATLASFVRISSCMPSARNAFSLASLKFSNGSTAIPAGGGPIECLFQIITPTTAGSATRDATSASAGLLRRHVARRSEHIERIGDRVFLFDQARQAKVGQMRFAFFIQQDIPGVNVAMQNAALMCELDCVRDLDEQFGRAPRRHR